MVYVITGGDDYESGEFNVTIPAGEIIVSFNVTIIEDDMFEINETFSLTIDPSSSVSCGVEEDPGDCITVVTIVDNDGE